MSASGIESRGACKNRRRVPRRSAPCPTPWCGSTASGSPTRRRTQRRGGAESLADLFDRQHEFADECLMPDPETGEPINVSHMIPRSRRRPQAAPCAAWSRLSEGTVGHHGPHARLHERDVRRLRPAPERVGRRRRAQRAGRARTSSPSSSRLARDDISLTHTIIQPTIDKRDRRQVRRQHGPAAQGRRDRRRHRRARRPHPGHAGALRRRDGGLPGPAPSAGARRTTPGLRHPDGHAGPHVPVPRQRVRAGRRSVRPAAVDPLRRAGRLRASSTTSRCRGTGVFIDGDVDDLQLDARAPATPST